MRVRIPEERLAATGSGKPATVQAEAALRLARDRFLGTEGLATVDYRITVPGP
jgi:hypothetical protein